MITNVALKKQRQRKKTGSKLVPFVIWKSQNVDSKQMLIVDEGKMNSFQEFVSLDEGF